MCWVANFTPAASYIGCVCISVPTQYTTNEPSYGTLAAVHLVRVHVQRNYTNLVSQETTRSRGRDGLSRLVRVRRVVIWLDDGFGKTW